jgi:antitoxin VapB
MGKEYKAKVFKSGNSLALRLPKELGLTEGSTMVLREDPRGYHFEPEEGPNRKLDIDRIWGIATAAGIEMKVPEHRDFEERPSTVAARTKLAGK